MEKVKKGLASLREHNEEIARRRAEMERPKANWFSIKSNESITVRFLQELDEEHAGYNEDRGTAIWAVEHNAPGPEGWKRRALCTQESENKCFACEQHRLDTKAGWKQKSNLYINVLLADGTVAVLARNLNSSFVQNLVEWSNENETITDRNFKITRTGEGTSTTWNLLPVLRGEPFDDSKVEVWNLEEVAIRDIEYDKQPVYYGVADVEREVEEPKEEAFSW